MAKKEKSPIEILIEDIQKNQALLTEKEQLLAKTKEEKKVITDFLKESKKDIGVLHKYATDEQKLQLENLGFDLLSSERGLNSVAQTALDIMQEKKSLTNEELYNLYLDSVPQTLDALDYTQFNIKIRTLFNSQYLIKTKNEESNSSRDDMISLNNSGE